MNPDGLCQGTGGKVPGSSCFVQAYLSLCPTMQVVGSILAPCPPSVPVAIASANRSGLPSQTSGLPREANCSRLCADQQPSRI